MSRLGAMIKQIREGATTVVHIRDIDFSTVEDSELKELASLIRDMKELSSVAFRNINLGIISVENLKLIFEAVQSRKEDLRISLVDNNLGALPDKFLFIMERLVHTNVSRLDLSANNLGILTEDALEKLLNFGPILTLKEIDLSDSALGQLAKKGLLMIGQYIVSCEGIGCLQLHHNSLGLNLFFDEFLVQLRQLPLEEMNLGDNDLGDLADPDREVKADMRKVIGLLARHPTLLRLNLADNLLCAWGAENLSLFLGFISQHNKLRQLDLRTNQFRDLSEYEGWDAFLDNFVSFVASAHNFGIKVTYDYCNFDEKDRALLMERINQHSSLMSQSFFGGAKEEASLPIFIERIAEAMVVVLQQIPSAKELFKQKDKLRDSLHQSVEVVISKIAEKEKSAASAECEGKVSLPAGN